MLATDTDRLCVSCRKKIVRGQNLACCRGCGQTRHVECAFDRPCTCGLVIARARPRKRRPVLAVLGAVLVVVAGATVALEVLQPELARELREQVKSDVRREIDRGRNVFGF